ncbi:hypothetical protein B7463_g5667, partial [Scytalidium lignicola]
MVKFQGRAKELIQNRLINGLPDPSHRDMLSQFIEAKKTHPDVAGGLSLSDGRALPRGTAVAISPWATHFGKETYGEDAHNFNPDRWLQSPNETKDRYDERLLAMNRADLSWSFGERACIGKDIAKYEVYKVIATLHSLFGIRLIDPISEWNIKETLLTKQSGMDVQILWRLDVTADRLANTENKATTDVEESQ